MANKIFTFRECLFPEEGNLKLHKKYSHASCLLECQVYIFSIIFCSASQGDENLVLLVVGGLFSK